MDGLKQDVVLMPAERPLPMPRQDFGKRFRDTSAPARKRISGNPWRLFVFLSAFTATGGLIAVILAWFADEGLSLAEGILLFLISFNFFWISFSFATVIAGFIGLARKGGVCLGADAQVTPISVALLMPVCDEDPALVMGNARTILEDLRNSGTPHRYALFILSDTRNGSILVRERQAFTALRAELPPGMEIFYRWRNWNSERKVGNIADWVRRWGGDWEAMVVLDADSLMTGKAVSDLVRELVQDPSAGLIQSFPQVTGSQSLFAWMQRFASQVYGRALAEGIARICGPDGNYWGHNAVLRTAAFAACAGLPPLPGRGKRQIMSHDFVEAGLLVRAGWTVRFLPQIHGSYEETPQTLIDHILRDRRWCQGNLQHLRILWARGFRPMSRFHLLHGAVGYLMSPIWFALLVFWALIGIGEDAGMVTYFHEASPLRPSWPEMTEGRHALIIVIMYAMLLAPKFVGIAALPLSGIGIRQFGGWGWFALSAVTEIMLAIVYAPILMVQRMHAVIRTVLGLQNGWNPQARCGGRYGWGDLLAFHWLETLSGAILAAGITAGSVSVWLLPIAMSLFFALPLSWLSGFALRCPPWMATGETDQVEGIESVARRHRQTLRGVLDGQNVSAK